MHPARRRLVFPSAAVAALAAVLAIALPLSSASAAAVSAAGTRVGASHPAMVPAVGASRPVFPVQGRCGPAPQPRFAAGACVAAEDTSDIPQILFRTGSRTDNALTDSGGVSFRSSVSSSANGEQVFRPGEKIWAVDTGQLPEDSVVVDNNPPGHVSVFASPDEIRAAVVPSGPENFLEQLGLKTLEEFGSYRLPR